MKFVSKQSNYQITLRPGISGSRVTGTHLVPGIYVRFEQGLATVNNEEHIEMMKKHPAFDRDFIIQPENKVDPYASTRKDTEPVHNIGQVKYGTVDGSLTPKPKLILSADKMKVVKEMIEKRATKMVEEMLPTLIENALKKKEQETKKEESKVSEKKVVDKKVLEKKEDAKK